MAAFRGGSGQVDTPSLSMSVDLSSSVPLYGKRFVEVTGDFEFETICGCFAQARGERACSMVVLAENTCSKKLNDNYLEALKFDSFPTCACDHKTPDRLPLVGRF